MRFLSAVVGAFAVVGCNASHRSVAPAPSAPLIRLAQCDGPATSLPDSLARQLPRRTGRMIPDDRWADLATMLPGGFAGAFYDSAHTPILMLAEPAESSAAKQALAGKVGFLPQYATVRQARWNFAQLVDWYNYLHPRLGVPVGADKDEAINRIRFMVATVEDRDRLVKALAQLPLPCDLVVVDLNGITVHF